MPLIHTLRQWRPQGQRHMDADGHDWCRGVDQSVAGVEHQIGGSSHGYRRWERFKAEGLSRYGSRRNNAMLRCGGGVKPPFGLSDTDVIMCMHLPFQLSNKVARGEAYTAHPIGHRAGEVLVADPLSS